MLGWVITRDLDSNGSRCVITSTNPKELLKKRKGAGIVLKLYGDQRSSLIISSSFKIVSICIGDHVLNQHGDVLSFC